MNLAISANQTRTEFPVVRFWNWCSFVRSFVVGGGGGGCYCCWKLQTRICLCRGSLALISLIYSFPPSQFPPSISILMITMQLYTDYYLFFYPRIQQIHILHSLVHIPHGNHKFSIHFLTLDNTTHIQIHSNRMRTTTTTMMHSPNARWTKI